MLTFGNIPAGTSYKEITGVYGILEKKGNIALLLEVSSKRYFLPGNDEVGEENLESVLRNSYFDKTGYEVQLSSYIGSTAEFILDMPEIEWIKKVFHFYRLECIGGKHLPDIESNFRIVWLDKDLALKMIDSQSFRWAIENYF